MAHDSIDLRNPERNRAHPIQQMQSSPVPSRSRGWLNASDLVLAAGFSFTGAGTIMLGVLLPVLSLQWSLRDDAAGFLLFLQFGGSSLGAIFSGLRRLRCLRIGYALLVAASGALAFAGPRSAFAIFFLFGLGLGISMTSTSLLFSDRYEIDRAQKLEALNFAWSVGAMAGPVLFLPFLRIAHLRLLFFTFQAVFLFILLWTLLRERADHGLQQAAEQPAAKHASLGVVLVLLAMVIGSVGVETSLSGWLTTYVHRLGPESGAALFPAALLYFGVVLSRLLCSTPRFGKIDPLRALQGLLWGTAGAVTLLIALHGPVAVDAAAALAGLCIGPLYPLVLAFLLNRNSRGWIFAVAGMAAAVFPWFTGVLSAHFGSLRYGLMAPLAAAWLMAMLRPLLFRSAVRPAAESPSSSA